jgi:hypothetical protein
LIKTKEDPSLSNVVQQASRRRNLENNKNLLAEQIHFIIRSWERQLTRELLEKKKKRFTPMPDSNVFETIIMRKSRRYLCPSSSDRVNMTRRRACSFLKSMFILLP